MYPIEKESLKPCPFCGKKSVLRVIDEHLQNDMITVGVCCENCHYTGKVILTFEHSNAVSEEVHNRIISKFSEMWNNWAEGTASTKKLLTICNTILELSCILERGHAVAQSLVSDYFADCVKVHEKNQGMWLLHCYDKARVFSEIAADYYEQALQMADKLMNSIDSDNIEQ